MKSGIQPMLYIFVPTCVRWRHIKLKLPDSPPTKEASKGEGGGGRLHSFLYLITDSLRFPFPQSFDLSQILSQSSCSNWRTTWVKAEAYISSRTLVQGSHKKKKKKYFWFQKSFLFPSWCFMAPRKNIKKLHVAIHDFRRRGPLRGKFRTSLKTFGCDL